MPQWEGLNVVGPYQEQRTNRVAAALISKWLQVICAGRVGRQVNLKLVLFVDRLALPGFLNQLSIFALRELH